MDKRMVLAAGLVFFSAASWASGPGKPARKRTARVRREASTLVLRASGGVEAEASRKGNRVPACGEFPRERASLISPGMPAEARLHPSNPGVFAGKVRSVSAPAQGSALETRKVCVELRDAGARLKPGDYLELLVRVPTSRLCIPAGALARSERGPEVLVVSEDGSPTPRAVEIADAEEGCVEAVSGVKEGEGVLIYPAEVSGP